MPVIKPPTKFKKRIFIAGSIEQGTAEDWQPLAEAAFSPYAIVLNPRRDQWNAALHQDISEPVFNEQVNWELDGIEVCDTFFFYLDPNTKSPITLAELGIVYERKRLLNDVYVTVVCPRGFWRRGNIQIMCHRVNIPLFDTFDAGMKFTVENYLREQ